MRESAPSPGPPAGSSHNVATTDVANTAKITGAFAKAVTETFGGTGLVPCAFLHGDADARRNARFGVE